MLTQPTQGAQIVLLLIKKVTILAKYLDFTDVFLKKLVAELFECPTIIKQIIDLEDDFLNL